MTSCPTSESSEDWSMGPKRFFRRHRNFLTALLLAMAAWLFYLPSVQYDFAYYDDVRILRDHPELYGQPLAADLKAIFVTEFPREEPLLVRDVTWALDSRVFGFGNPFGYHLNNVLLHGVVVALLFFFLFGTTRRYGFALATSIAYLILAIHTEPVSWIMGRKDILSALFMLLALCAQTQRLTSKTVSAQTGWYLITLSCFVLGLLSKISVLTFPLVLFLQALFFQYLCEERQPRMPLEKRTVVLETLLFVPFLVISGVIYIWYQRTLAQMGIFDRGYMAHGLAHFWNLLMVDPLAFWVYLRQIFFPWHLNVLYLWPALHFIYPPWQIAVALATTASIVGIGALLLRYRKDIFFYYAVFFVLMIPYLNLVYIGIWVAERYLYFSSFCVLAIAVLLADGVLRRPYPTLRICILVASIIFVAINLFQKLSYQPAWRNAETLWQYHVTLPHPSTEAYENLAVYYITDAAAHENTSRTSVSLHKAAIVVDAGLTEFWPNRQKSAPPETYYLFFLQSILQEANGDQPEALASLLTADRLRPRFGEINLKLARLYRELAGTAQAPQQRETYARAARDRFKEYISIAFKDRPVPPEVRQESADIDAQYAAFASPTNNATTVEKKSNPQ